MSESRETEQSLKPTFFGLEFEESRGFLNCIRSNPPEWGEQTSCWIECTSVGRYRSVIQFEGEIQIWAYGEDPVAAAHALEVKVLRLRELLEWILRGTPGGRCFVSPAWPAGGVSP